jgi:hypothetical protein
LDFAEEVGVFGGSSVVSPYADARFSMIVSQLVV